MLFSFKSTSGSFAKTIMISESLGIEKSVSRATYTDIILSNKQPYGMVKLAGTLNKGAYQHKGKLTYSWLSLPLLKWSCVVNLELTECGLHCEEC
jgi:hypothetical protein